LNERRAQASREALKSIRMAAEKAVATRLPQGYIGLSEAAELIGLTRQSLLFAVKRGRFKKAITVPWYAGQFRKKIFLNKSELESVYGGNRSEPPAGGKAKPVSSGGGRAAPSKAKTVSSGARRAAPLKAAPGTLEKALADYLEHKSVAQLVDATHTVPTRELEAAQIRHRQADLGLMDSILTSKAANAEHARILAKISAISDIIDERPKGRGKGTGSW